MNARYLFPGDYMADPSAHFWDGRIWIYPSHDRESGIPERDNGDHFDMRDYHVLSIEPDAEGTVDPMAGKVVDHGVILDIADVPWAKRQLWDSDVARKDGRYHLIFSAKDRDDVFRLGHAVAERPEGPFVPDPEPIPGSYSIDPCIFSDPRSGGFFVAFGGLWGGQLQRYRDNRAVHSAAEDTLPDGTRCALEPADGERALCAKIARLSDDFASFAEAPRDIEILGADGGPILAGDHGRRFFEASWIHYSGGKYRFSYSTGDTHLLCEASSDSVYGPYRFDRVLLGPQVGWTTHHSVCCVPALYSATGDDAWYLFHHDAAPSGGRTWLRSVKVAPFDAAGNA